MAVGNAINQNTAGVTGFTGTAFTGTPVTQYNVLTGGATTSTLNNVAPSATSGVPLISQGNAAHPAFGTAVVAGGGTGNTTFTAYSVICAGTTATGPFQNVSGVGTSGQHLKSNGAGSLPTWQNASSSTAASFTLQTGSGNPADGATYYLQTTSPITTFTATNNTTRYYIPKNGTINRVYGNINVAGTLGTTESTTLALRLNNTSNSNVSTSLQLSAANVAFNNTALGLSVTAGDFIEVLLICPSWSTNPTTVKVNVTFLLN